MCRLKACGGMWNEKRLKNSTPSKKIKTENDCTVLSKMF